MAAKTRITRRSLAPERTEEVQDLAPETPSKAELRRQSIAKAKEWAAERKNKKKDDHFVLEDDDVVDMEEEEEEVVEQEEVETEVEKVSVSSIPAPTRRSTRRSTRGTTSKTVDNQNDNDNVSVLSDATNQMNDDESVGTRTTRRSSRRRTMTAKVIETKDEIVKAPTRRSRRKTAVHVAVTPVLEEEPPQEEVEEVVEEEEEVAEVVAEVVVEEVVKQPRTSRRSRGKTTVAPVVEMEEEAPETEVVEEPELKPEEEEEEVITETEELEVEEVAEEEIVTETETVEVKAQEEIAVEAEQEEEEEEELAQDDIAAETEETEEEEEVVAVQEDISVKAEIQAEVFLEEEEEEVLAQEEIAVEEEEVKEEDAVQEEIAVEMEEEEVMQEEIAIETEEKDEVEEETEEVVMEEEVAVKEEVKEIECSEQKIKEQEPETEVMVAAQEETSKFAKETESTNSNGHLIPLFFHLVLVSWTLAFAAFMTFGFDWWLVQVGHETAAIDMESQRATCMTLGLWLVSVAGYAAAFGAQSRAGWIITGVSMAMASFAAKFMTGPPSLPIYSISGFDVNVPDMLVALCLVGFASVPKAVAKEETVGAPEAFIGQRVSIEKGTVAFMGTVKHYDAETRQWLVQCDDESQ